jgi:hypothetical protein
VNPTQQPMVPQGYELKRKKPIYKRIWFWLLILVVVIIIVATQAGGGSGGGSGASGTVEVVYTVESDSPTVSATYATADSNGVGQSQDNSVAPPWTKTVTAEDSWVKSFVLTGQMNPVLDGSAADGTTITCRITVDGEVVAEQTSTGQYAMATCSAS